MPLEESQLGSQLAAAVMRQALAHIALACGCKHSYIAVLDALAELTREFIITIGLEARTKSEYGGRSLVSILDILAALKERQRMGRDSYDVDWHSLQRFAFGHRHQGDEQALWYQPFRTHIPEFPVSSGRSHNMPCSDSAAVPATQSASLCLPKLPPTHTYCQTALQASVNSESAADGQLHMISTRQRIMKAIQETSSHAL